ncbi:hypothetical protein Vafri_210, partial [Volvox africanus]
QGSSLLGAGRKNAVKAGEGARDNGNLIVDPDTPPSFSQVPMGDPRVSDAQLAAEFPRFPGRSAALEVVVEAGDVLFLPAGWFHEVTSYGSAGGKNGGHLAFNYWYHPPDNLDPSRRGFLAPYNSDFWPSLWRARVTEGLPGGIESGLGAQPPPPPAGEVGEDSMEANGGGADDVETAEVERKSNRRKDLKGAGRQWNGGGDNLQGRKRNRLDGPMSGGNDSDEKQGHEQDPEGGADGDGDLDPPRRKPAADARALMAKLAAARAGGSDGETSVELTDEEYQLLLEIEEARRRNTAIQAMRVFLDRQMKLQRLRRMRSRLPPGRRHHPVIVVNAEVRSWRPKTTPMPHKQEQQVKQQQRKTQQQQHQHRQTQGKEQKEKRNQQEPKRPGENGQQHPATERRKPAAVAVPSAVDQGGDTTSKLVPRRGKRNGGRARE